MCTYPLNQDSHLFTMGEERYSPTPLRCRIFSSVSSWRLPTALPEEPDLTLPNEVASNGNDKRFVFPASLPSLIHCPDDPRVCFRNQSGDAQPGNGVLLPYATYSYAALNGLL